MSNQKIIAKGSSVSLSADSSFKPVTRDARFMERLVEFIGLSGFLDRHAKTTQTEAKENRHK